MSARVSDGQSMNHPARRISLRTASERPPDLDPNLSPRLRVPARLQHHAHDTVDAEPRALPEAGVGVGHFAFGPRDGATLIRRAVEDARLGRWTVTAGRRPASHLDLRSLM